MYSYCISCKDRKDDDFFVACFCFSLWCLCRYISRQHHLTINHFFLRFSNAKRKSSEIFLMFLALSNSRINTLPASICFTCSFSLFGSQVSYFQSGNLFSPRLQWGCIWKQLVSVFHPESSACHCIREASGALDTYWLSSCCSISDLSSSFLHFNYSLHQKSLCTAATKLANQPILMLTQFS